MLINTGQLLLLLRGLMLEKQIRAYIIPREDSHLSPDVSDCDRRLRFITKYTGSSGTAIVLEREAALWTDGRYFLQAEQELDDNWILQKSGQPGVPSQAEWLIQNLNANDSVGIDPKLYSKSAWDSLSSNLASKGIKLKAIELNLIDEIWENKPACAGDKINIHPIEYAGENSTSKIEKISNAISEAKVDLVVISELNEVAWTLNLRGNEFIPFNPVFFSYLAIQSNKNFTFFVNSNYFGAGVENYIKNELKGHIQPYENIFKFLGDFANNTNGKIWLSTNCNQALALEVPKSQQFIQRTPVNDLKIYKNKQEIEGMYRGHLKDGAAVVQFFAWLEEELEKGNIYNEIEASKKLEDFRKGRDNFIMPAFGTITASGPNAAIIHYSPVNSLSLRNISKNEILLVDSGGHYSDGATTDITRTVHFGTPTPKEIECFTRVLKGQMLVKRSSIAYNTKGDFLDKFARQYLWKIGLDYNHGTGHGMGSFLIIHDGGLGGIQAFKENMFMSNEPGYYEDNKFGIRIENIVQTVIRETKYNFGIKTYLGFEDVTFAPIQTKLIDKNLLSSEELDYLNNYHKSVREKLEPLLAGDQRAINYLIKETRNL